MVMSVDIFPIFACAVLAMVLGAVWYGPLFGTLWMRVIGATEMDREARKAMQKKALPLYVVQFLLVLFQVYVLANLLTMGGWRQSGLGVSFWMFLGFVMPTIAASSMWNNDSRQIAWTRFLIQSGYQLVLFLLFGYVLSIW